MEGARPLPPLLSARRIQGTCDTPGSLAASEVLYGNYSAAFPGGLDYGTVQYCTVPGAERQDTGQTKMAITNCALQLRQGDQAKKAHHLSQTTTVRLFGGVHVGCLPRPAPTYALPELDMFPAGCQAEGLRVPAWASWAALGPCV